MKGWQLAIASLLYASVAWDFLKLERPGAFIAWTFYAGANLGFLYDMLRK